MKAKEKAEELIRKYKGFSCKTCFGVESDIVTAKQCATICVDEIINDNPNIYDSDRLNFEYWKKVREYIQEIA